MIGKLRKKLTLLVIAVLVLVSAGIVLAITLVNYHNIDISANAALELMRENPTRRFGLLGKNGADSGPFVPFDGVRPSEAPELPEGVELGEDGFAGRELRQGERRWTGDFSVSGDAFASLSNYYTILLDEDGGVTSWEGDRGDLYSDTQIQTIADEIIATGRESGRVGTQYFCLTQGEDDARMLIVLDARLEFLSAQRMLRTTALVAALACLLLSAGAIFLIRRMLAPVQESFDRQKQFVWDASHEFKTPLAVISANAEVLAGEIGENEYLGYIQSEVRRTDQLVQNLLTLARMDKGTVAAEMKRFNLSNALLGVALPFESTVFEAGKRLETDIPEDIWYRGDEGMLQQLAVILLSNALKYSDEGGTIVMKLFAKGKGVALHVRNTGEGIEPDKLEKIFDRFYRGDTSHNSEISGNGLGLAIARTIVEAHKGKIYAESEPGKWAEFIVTLPGGQ